MTALRSCLMGLAVSLVLLCGGGQATAAEPGRDLSVTGIELLQLAQYHQNGRCHHHCEREYEHHSNWCRANRHGHHLHNCLEKARQQFHICQRECRR